MTVCMVTMAVALPAVMGRVDAPARCAQAGVIVQAAAWALLLPSGLVAGGSIADRSLSTLAMAGLAAGLALNAAAFDLWCGRKPQIRVPVLIAVVMPVGYAIGFASYPFRVGWANGLLTLQMAFLVASVWRKPAVPVGKWRWLLVVCLLAQMTVTAGRGALGAFFTESYPSFLAPHPVNLRVRDHRQRDDGAVADGRAARPSRRSGARARALRHRRQPHRRPQPARLDEPGGHRDGGQRPLRPRGGGADDRSRSLQADQRHAGPRRRRPRARLHRPCAAVGGAARRPGRPLRRRGVLRPDDARRQRRGERLRRPHADLPHRGRRARARLSARLQRRHRLRARPTTRWRRWSRADATLYSAKEQGRARTLDAQGLRLRSG